MPLAGLETAIPASDRPQIVPLDQLAVINVIGINLME
jgi:hypothetical protein